MKKTCRSFPPEVSEVVSSFKMGVHPVARLIKDLTFEYRPEVNRTGPGIYWGARLAVTAPPWASFAAIFAHYSMSSPDSLVFALSDFGYQRYTTGYDRYVEDSNLASGLSMGRVLE